MDFLQLLRDRVRAGLSGAPAAYREKHARWLAGQAGPAGGFANRRGRVELYYTTFAVRALSVLGSLSPEIAERTVAFLLPLSANLGPALSDCVSAVSWWDTLVICEEVLGPRLDEARRGLLAEQTETRLNTLRRGDGGWAKTPVEGSGSLYHTFLAACVYERMGRPLPERESAAGFLKTLARPEGGCLENRFSKRPGTNGTAAGVALSLILDGSDGSGSRTELVPHANYVQGLRGEEGGFLAAPGAPIADLLSTFTALFTLELAGAADPHACASALEYARGLEDDGGGYAGFALETIVDCEYTFYGLGVEGLAGTAPHIHHGGTETRRHGGKLK